MAREDLGGDYLRLTVTDRYAGLELHSALRERFPYLLELYGKAAAVEGGRSSLTHQELENLDETSIMIKFMEENHQYSPTSEQIGLFREVLAWSREEGDLG